MSIAVKTNLQLPRLSCSPLPFKDGIPIQAGMYIQEGSCVFIAGIKVSEMKKQGKSFNTLLRTPEKVAIPRAFPSDFNINELGFSVFLGGAKKEHLYSNIRFPLDQIEPSKLRHSIEQSLSFVSDITHGDLVVWFEPDCSDKNIFRFLSEVGLLQNCDGIALVARLPNEVNGRGKGISSNFDAGSISNQLFDTSWFAHLNRTNLFGWCDFQCGKVVYQFEKPFELSIEGNVHLSLTVHDQSNEAFQLPICFVGTSRIFPQKQQSRKADLAFAGWFKPDELSKHHMVRLEESDLFPKLSLGHSTLLLFGLSAGKTSSLNEADVPVILGNGGASSLENTGFGVLFTPDVSALYVCDKPCLVVASSESFLSGDNSFSVPSETSFVASVFDDLSLIATIKPGSLLYCCDDEDQAELAIKSMEECLNSDVSFPNDEMVLGLKKIASTSYQQGLNLFLRVNLTLFSQLAFSGTLRFKANNDEEYNSGRLPEQGLPEQGQPYLLNGRWVGDLQSMSTLLIWLFKFEFPKLIVDKPLSNSSIADGKVGKGVIPMVYMRANAYFLDQAIENLDVYFTEVVCPNRTCSNNLKTEPSTSHFETNNILSDNRNYQLSWTMNVGVRGSFLLPAETLLHCTFEQNNNLQIAGWRSFKVDDSLLKSLDLPQVFREYINNISGCDASQHSVLDASSHSHAKKSCGKIGDFSAAHSNSGRASSHFQYELRIQPRLVKSNVSQGESSVDFREANGSYQLALDCQFSITLGFTESFSLDESSTHCSVNDNRFEVCHLDLPAFLHIEPEPNESLKKLEERLNRLLQQNMGKLGFDLVQSLIGNPNALACFLVFMANESDTSNRKFNLGLATKYAEILACKKLTFQKVVVATGLAEQALLHLTYNEKACFPAIVRAVLAVIDGRLGMMDVANEAPQITRIQFVPKLSERDCNLTNLPQHSDDKTYKSSDAAHLLIRWVAVPEVATYQLMLTDFQGNELLKKPRALSSEILSECFFEDSILGFEYALPVNTNTWEEGVYFATLASIPSPRKTSVESSENAGNSMAVPASISVFAGHSTVGILKPHAPNLEAELCTIVTPDCTEYAKSDLTLSFSWDVFPGTECYQLKTTGEVDLQEIDLQRQPSLNQYCFDGKPQILRQDVLFSEKYLAGCYGFYLERISDGSYIDGLGSELQLWDRLSTINEISLEVMLNTSSGQPVISIWWDGNMGDIEYFPKVCMDLVLQTESRNKLKGETLVEPKSIVEFVPESVVKSSQVLVEISPVSKAECIRVSVRTIKSRNAKYGELRQIPSVFTSEIIIYPPDIMAIRAFTGNQSAQDCAETIFNVYSDITPTQLIRAFSSSGYTSTEAIQGVIAIMPWCTEPQLHRALQGVFE